MILELKNISKSYSINNLHEQSVLKDISFGLNKGNIMTVSGPSGSGKSTLLNIIGLLDKPNSGELMIVGSNTSKLSESELARLRNTTIGFIFQAHHLLPQLTVVENVLLPTLPLNRDAKSRAKKRALELLSFVGMSDHIYKTPGHLSGGECQRVAVVRSLINNPDLLLADEPTGSLDESNAMDIGRLLIDLNKEHKCSMIVVTHSAELARLIGNIHILKEGRLVKS